MRAALEVLWAADEAARNGRFRRLSEDDGPSEEDPAIALATAQSILVAADITLPTGDLYNGAYDAFGNYYQLLHQIVADPQNLLWGSPEDDGLDDVKTAMGGEDAQDHDDEAERRREEKGKAVVDVRDQITIRARLSDGSRDVNVAIGKGDSVRRVARLIAEEAKVSSLLLSPRRGSPADSEFEAPLRQEDTHRLHGEDIPRRLVVDSPGLE